ncbi:MAG: hypothetical protein JXQ96_01960 [Cyclobacteriaceae bacterium]
MNYKYFSGFLLLSFLGFKSINEKNAPMFFNMGDEWQKATITADSIVFQSMDSLMQHQVNILMNADKEALLYFSDLETTVCADGECRLARIKLYWNLLGNYVGFGIHHEDPLTKYDHDPFDSEDYSRLHGLLMDNNSILRRKKMDDLVIRVPTDSSQSVKNVSVDGMTSATKKEIKEAVVEGGLYSCYTLWHLIHGEIKQKMKDRLKENYNDSIQLSFLFSEYQDYQTYALKKMDAEDFALHGDRIAHIFNGTSPLNRGYIMKKMPINMLIQEGMVRQFYTNFSALDVNSRTQLIQKLNESHHSAVEILSSYAQLLTRNQLKLYLEFLLESQSNLTATVVSNLELAQNSKEYAFVYLIDEFFEELEM